MTKVFVGLSGGVDSAVSAALLKERGFDVTGAFIKIWQPEFTECTWREDRLDAMRVASALGIPFREIDLSVEYKKEVVEQMIGDYERGITPNPDVLCNRIIKFGHFAKWAKAEGAEFIATGHYAQIKESGGAHELHRGADSGKDQSYFLYRLSQNDLASSFFPVGGLTKSNVRTLAKKFDLPVSSKPDSQGLCFVGDVSIPEFLSRYITLRSGEVLDRTGKTIGSHEGAALFTIGQRHGFAAASDVPLYVISIDTKNNTITTDPDRAKAARTTVRIEDVHWIKEPPQVFEADGQARYHETPVRASVVREGAGARVTFSEPHITAKGQSLVLYIQSECVGGGVIAE